MKYQLYLFHCTMLSILRIKSHYFYLSVTYSASLMSSNTPGNYQIWFCSCYFSSNSPSSALSQQLLGSLLATSTRKQDCIFYFYLCWILVLSLMSSFFWSSGTHSPLVSWEREQKTRCWGFPMCISIITYTRNSQQSSFIILNSDTAEV